MRPDGQPPDKVSTKADIHAPDNNIPSAPRRKITRVTRDESNRRFRPECALAIFKYVKSDIKYIHNTIKFDTCYWEDDSATFRVYHFSNKTNLDDTLADIDKAKMSSAVDIRLGLDIDTATRESNSDSPASTTDDTDTERDWKIQKSRKKRKPKTDKLDASKKDTTTAPQAEIKNPTDSVSPDHATPEPLHNVKIHNHTIKSGNPLFIKAVLTNHNIPNPTKQFYSHKLKMTTLQFEQKPHLILFLEKIPPSLFGEKASYELYKPARTSAAPRDATQDWNAVIRGVDPDIDLDDFNKELVDHEIKFRRTSRITTPNGDKTHMVRIYFDDQDSAKDAIFNGITILGRRFRVEPPRVEARHIPCRKCSQYGHSIKECKNSAVCIRCGGKPGSCSHPPNANVLFCATCGGKDHYTGQVRCRLYPRSSAPPEQPRQMPLPKQTTISPTRPSATDFPALRQNVWKTNPQTQTEPTTTPTTSTPRERSLPSSLDDRLEAALTKAMQVTMTKLEAYIDARLTAALDQMIKFTLTVVNNAVKPTQTKTIQTTANNTAKKLWRKRVQMVPLKNTIDVLISDMKDDLRQDLRSLIINNLNPDTPTPENV